MAAVAVLVLALLWALLAEDGSGRGEAAGSGTGRGGGAGSGAGPGSGTTGSGPGAGVSGNGPGAGDAGRGVEAGPPGDDRQQAVARPQSSQDELPSPAKPTAVSPQRPKHDVLRGFVGTVPTPPRPSTRPPPSHPRAGGGTSGATGTAGIFDHEGRGKRLVYVIDFSGSMQGERFEAARFELLKAIKSLSEDMDFFVIFFDDGELPMPAPGMLPATKETKDRMCEWIWSIECRGGTNPTGAMLRALALKPETAWLLSDGNFDPAVCDAIANANPGKKVSIHTIAFHDPAGEDVLKRIAAENRGDYRFVPP